MDKRQNRLWQHKDSTDLVSPYARIRVIVFLIYIAIALAALAYEAFAA